MTLQGMPGMVDFRADSLSGIDPLCWRTAGQLAESALHDMLDAASHGAALDWWLHSPASRNPFISPLYSRLRVLSYVGEACRSHWRAAPPARLCVDSSSLAALLKTRLAQEGLSCVAIDTAPAPSRLRARTGRLRNLGGHILRFCLLGFPRFDRAKAARIGVLVDTFILKEWSGGDRYYPGMLESLGPEQRDAVWFVPEWLGASPARLRAQKRILRRSGVNVLLKESLLGISDYFYAFYRALRPLRVPQRGVFVCGGVEVSALIREELASGQGLDQTIRGWLNYRFFRRLKQAGIAPGTFVDWFENQSVDKGWNKGVRDFFPHARSVGYQGFSDVPGYFCMFPTEAERAAGVLPGVLAVMGDGFRESRIRYCPTLPVMVAPAFRFAHLWRPLDQPLTARTEVLVALPIDEGVSARIIEVVFALPPDWWQARGLSLRIKLHPARRIESLPMTEISAKRLRDQLEYRAFPEAIEQARVLLGTMSSTCFEAVMRQVPVIVFGDHGDHFNTIPTEVPDSMVGTFSDAAELMAEIDRVCSAQTQTDPPVEAQLHALRSTYFCRVCDNSVQRLLGLYELPASA